MNLRPLELSTSELDGAATFLRDSDEVMLTSHVNSDGDGVGSCLALAGLLRSLGKTPSIVLQDFPADTYSFLEGFDAIIQACLLYTSPSPRDLSTSRMPSSA